MGQSIDIRCLAVMAAVLCCVTVLSVAQFYVMLTNVKQLFRGNLSIACHGTNHRCQHGRLFKIDSKYLECSLQQGNSDKLLRCISYAAKEKKATYRGVRSAAMTSHTLLTPRSGEAFKEKPKCFVELISETRLIGRTSAVQLETAVRQKTCHCLCLNKGFGAIKLPLFLITFALGNSISVSHL